MLLLFFLFFVQNGNAYAGKRERSTLLFPCSIRAYLWHSRRTRIVLPPRSIAFPCDMFLVLLLSQILILFSLCSIILLFFYLPSLSVFCSFRIQRDACSRIMLQATVQSRTFDSSYIVILCVSHHLYLSSSTFIVTTLSFFWYVLITVVFIILLSNFSLLFLNLKITIWHTKTVCLNKVSLTRNVIYKYYLLCRFIFFPFCICIIFESSRTFRS